MKIYPIKFKPILKDKIWGGTLLGTKLRKPIGHSTCCGESWELSSVEGDVSIIANGELKGLSLRHALKTYGVELVGREVYERCGTEFPLLIKFIDAADDLSIQVHPDDEMAARRGLSNGKTEMWYVMHAEPNSVLTTGFCRPITADDYEKMLRNGTFQSALGRHHASEGEVYFMPAGRIHAIGKGIMVAEVQQTSDTTYRVYDYDRRDKTGKLRDLHVAEAKEALHFTDTDSGHCHYDTIVNGRAEVVDCQYFSAGIVSVCGTTMRDYSRHRSAVILMCVSGEAMVDGESLQMGETCMLPAITEHVQISSTNGEARLLEIYVK